MSASREATHCRPASLRAGNEAPEPISGALAAFNAAPELFRSLADTSSSTRFPQHRGALYHAECWQECAQQYGGCAVYGCSSKKCREVSAAGYFVRLGRLGLAALLFPPRIARALRKAEGEGFRAIYRRAVRATRWVGVSTDETTNSQAKMAIHIGLSIAVVLGVGAIAGTSPWLARWLTTHGTFWVLAPLFFVLPLLIPWIVALPATLAFFTLRAVAIAFKTELAQLGRADEGGGTVLGRLAAGFGKKS